MASEGEIADFVRTTFRSVWSLELLLLMADNPGRSWSTAELIGALRASDLIIDRSSDELIAAGLVVPEKGNSFRYAPSSSDLPFLVEGARRLYKNSPGSVRRIIINGHQSGISAFADAFRLRKD